MFLLILLLEVIAALAMGMMISAAAATPELALAIGIPVTIISFVFAGFYSKSAYRCLRKASGIAACVQRRTVGLPYYLHL
jgi:uncharacterized membrane protein (DUF485 family)